MPRDALPNPLQELTALAGWVTSSDLSLVLKWAEMILTECVKCLRDCSCSQEKNIPWCCYGWDLSTYTVCDVCAVFLSLCAFRMAMGDVDHSVSLFDFQLSFQRANLWWSITNGIAGIGALLTYFPQRVRPAGETKMDIAKKFDYVGGIISIAGLTLLFVSL
jgi:hypothetical protein